jgi:hypothetical protein
LYESLSLAIVAHPCTRDLYSLIRKEGGRVFQI